MNIQAYESMPANHNFGLEIDSLIKIKEEAKLSLVRSKMLLLDAGAKTLIGETLIHLPNLDVEKYKKCRNQEFSWEVEYREGLTLKQFDGKKEYHYGSISQSALKKIKFVSNFTEETSNLEKRVVLTLDWVTGTWNLLNGFASKDVRALFDIPFPEGANPKLILKAVNRASATVDIQAETQADVVLYNRYLLGWEDVKLNKKVLFCIEPNGYVHLWHQN